MTKKRKRHARVNVGGGVSYIKDRNKYRASVTIGRNPETGRPVKKTLIECVSRMEAQKVFDEYQRKPYNIDGRNIKLRDLWDNFIKYNKGKYSDALKKCLKTGYNYCTTLYDTQWEKIPPLQVQDIIDNCGHGQSTQAKIRNVFAHLEKFAAKTEVSERRFADTLTTSDNGEHKEKNPFSDIEMRELWKLYNSDLGAVRTALRYVIVMIYTGFRINEFLGIELVNINFDERTIQMGERQKAKNDNSKNRKVPIHSDILSLVQDIAASNIRYLAENDGAKLYDSKFRKNYWKPVMECLRSELEKGGVQGELIKKHTHHDTRRTLRTKLDNADANQVAIDRIMGHASVGTGRKIYTHKDISQLHEAMAKIKDWKI